MHIDDGCPRHREERSDVATSHPAVIARLPQAAVATSRLAVIARLPQAAVATSRGQ